MLHALLRRGEARLEQSSLSKNIETFLFVLFFSNPLSFRCATQKNHESMDD